MRTLLFALSLLIYSIPVNAALVEIDQTDLDTARNKWISSGIENYSYHAQRQCFCLLDFVEPRLVTVTGGSVTEVLYLSTMTEDTDYDPSNFGPIDSFFGILQSALDAGAFSVKAMFDADIGIPTGIFIDYVELLADEEYGLSVSDFSPTPIPLPASLPLLGLAVVGLVTWRNRRRPVA